MSSIISKRYADTLLEFSHENKNQDKTFKDINQLSILLGQSEDLSKFLKNPSIETTKQMDVIEALFSKSLEKSTVTFLKFLAKKNRLNLLSEISKEFCVKYYHFNNIENVFITSSVKLSKSQDNALKQHLKLKLRKEIQSENIVEKDLIGGLKIKIGDKIFDYSIKTQLENFKQSIIHG